MIRRRWIIGGQVQGVGFRPFLYRLATQAGLTGFVRNTAQGVELEAQGDAAAVEAFARELLADPSADGHAGSRPALALLRSIQTHDIPLVPTETAFHIVDSHDAHGQVGDVTVDTAVCEACLRDMRTPGDRRQAYGLTNCTNCGPRYTIIRKVPYDRPHTTMADFALCPDCAAEYADPANRRFHAQPTACAVCGPKVTLVDNQGRPTEGDPILGAVGRILEGEIVAIKGLGGFHLATRADDVAAVARLRQLKHRDAKPFAVMCGTLEDARRIVVLSPKGVELLKSPARPIVLAPKRPWSGMAEGEAGVAPGTYRLGVMLPYTPIHHLLFARARAIGHGTFDRGFGTWVMTSANVSDEPLVIDNAEAVDRLRGICDAILYHDRPIERAVDDSVFIDMGDESPLPLRRSRGYVPSAIALGETGPLSPARKGAGLDVRSPSPHAPAWGSTDPATPPSPARKGAGLDVRPPSPHASAWGSTNSASAGLCMGGDLKSVAAVVRNGSAVLSQHLGDLTHPLAFAHFRKALTDLQNLFAVDPQWVACDLHPMYLSRQEGMRIAEQLGVPVVGVQHHHAHAAACMAEHGETGPVLAVVCDGTGYGEDGTIWGGELLLADLLGYQRLARLRPMLLAGGDAAAKDARRCGLGLLWHGYGPRFLKARSAERMLPADEREIIGRMIREMISCTWSSGAGRVFDGVAAILGISQGNCFEAQAAMALEAAAQRAAWQEADHPTAAVWYEIDRRRTPWEINLGSLVREMVARLAKNWAPADLAAFFHEQFARAWYAVVTAAARETAVRTVALSGGVFCNERLTKRLAFLLEGEGFRVLRHQLVPPNDGGLALGQAAVALARTSATSNGEYAPSGMAGSIKPAMASPVLRMPVAPISPHASGRSV